MLVTFKWMSEGDACFCMQFFVLCGSYVVGPYFYMPPGCRFAPLPLEKKGAVPDFI